MTTISVDLVTAVGQQVRVGGLVVDLRPDGFTLDDGTAVGTDRAPRRPRSTGCRSSSPMTHST